MEIRNIDINYYYYYYYYYKCVIVSGSFTFILAYLTTRQDITDSYFHLGMHYKEILLLILTHGFYFSMRQLKRILKSRGLGRRKNRSSLREVGGCIKMELCGSGNTINDAKTHGSTAFVLTKILSGTS